VPAIGGGDLCFSLAAASQKQKGTTMNDTTLEQRPAGLAATEKECAEGRTAPRVSLDDIEAAIAGVFYRQGDEFLDRRIEISGELRTSVATLTIALVVLNNGFTVIGKSAPASPANFDPALGKKLAYEDAVRQIWPLMGFALRERLFGKTTSED
jgi:hypothetical protein